MEDQVTRFEVLLASVVSFSVANAEATQAVAGSPCGSWAWTAISWVRDRDRSPAVSSCTRVVPRAQACAAVPSCARVMVHGVPAVPDPAVTETISAPPSTSLNGNWAGKPTGADAQYTLVAELEMATPVVLLTDRLL